MCVCAAEVMDRTWWGAPLYASVPHMLDDFRSLEINIDDDMSVVSAGRIKRFAVASENNKRCYVYTVSPII